MHLNDYAFSNPRDSPRRSQGSHAPQVSRKANASPNMTTWIVIGVVLVLALIAIPVMYRFFTTPHDEDSEERVPVAPTPSKTYNEDSSMHSKLDMGKYKEDISLNEFIKSELNKMLPNLELLDKLSVFLSSDISDKMMKCYHDESLNLFNTKIDECDVHRTILKDKFSKGKIIGETLLKEIENYEQCHPALHQLIEKLVNLVKQYKNIYNSKSDFDSALSNLLTQIKNKESELAKLKREYDSDRNLLLKNQSELKFNNVEEKLTREIEKLKTEIKNLREFLKEHPEKQNSRNEKLAELRKQLEKLEKEKADLILKKDELSEFAHSVELEAHELSSKEILDILRSDRNSRIQKLQHLAQNILDSANWEKNEVYHHRKATPDDKKKSILTLDDMKSRYKYILQLIIKVSYKVYQRMKNQLKSDEKTNKFQTIYGEIKDMEIKIEALKVKIQDYMNQIKKLQDEIGVFGDQIREKEESLRNKETQLAENEVILHDLMRKMKEIKDQLADLFIDFEAKEKAIKAEIKKLEDDKHNYEQQKLGYSDNLNKAFKEFMENATSHSKKINDCKINENLIKRMIENFLSFHNELEKFEGRSQMLEVEIRKMYESLENQANMP